MRKIKLFVLLLIGIQLVLSCGKPTTPETVPVPDVSGGYKIVKKFPTSGFAEDLVKKDTLLYVAQGEGGLLIVNITDPINPKTVSVITENVRGYSVKIAMRDTVAYLAAGSFGVTVVDVANPFEPMVTVSNLNMKPAKNIHIMGDWMFVAVSEQGVNIADISYPTQPDVRGSIKTSGYAYGLTTSADSNYLFVACGEMGMYIYDISDFQQGYGNYREVAWCDTPGKAETVKIIDNESIAFLACATAGLQIIDYSDTTNVHIIGSYDGSGYAKDLVIRDKKIFMTVETSGLQVIDVSDYTNPKIIGEVDTEFSLGIVADDKYIYIADDIEGLVIMSIPE